MKHRDNRARRIVGYQVDKPIPDPPSLARCGNTYFSKCAVNSCPRHMPESYSILRAAHRKDTLPA